MEGLPIALHDGPLVAVDLVSGEALPCEDIPNTKRHVKFFARDIPAVGYRMYSIEPAQGEVATTKGGFQLEGGWDESGRLVSIFDRSADRELLLPESGRPFGGLYVAIDRKEHREAQLGPGRGQGRRGPGFPACLP